MVAPILKPAGGTAPSKLRRPQIYCLYPSDDVPAARTAHYETIKEPQRQRVCQADAREIGGQRPQVGLYPGGTGVDDEVIWQPIELGAKGAANIEVLH